MKRFAMCPECAREYRDPRDRRFDAQPIACPRCGPQLALWDGCGIPQAERDDALLLAADGIRLGRIVALKGLGGFQLVVDAHNEEAVTRLRTRKRREEKPFALMFPSLAAVREVCSVSELEERALCLPESPIVLAALAHRPEPAGGRACLGHNPSLGVMLPYTPLHHLLMAELGFPIVATSGNPSDCCIRTERVRGLKRLRGIA